MFKNAAIKRVESHLQTEKTNVLDRNKHILQTKKWSDCKFRVGIDKQMFYAHKLLLSMASPVFEAMLFGEMAEQNIIIEITDIQPDTFQALLNYIYTDVTNFTSFDSVCDLCYAAKKYLLSDLLKQCSDYLSRNLKAANACVGYECSDLFDDEMLKQRSLQIIISQTDKVVQHSSFEDIQLKTLFYILDQDALQISSELKLFEAVHRWSAKECKRKNLSSSLVRKVIEPALHKIRFLTMTGNEFANGQATSQLLTERESYSILMNILTSKCNLPLPTGFSNSVKPRYKTNHHIEQNGLFSNNNYAFLDHRRSSRINQSFL